MNERIKELAKKSLPEFYLTNCPSALEKFAELIVRECTQSIENTIQTNCETDGEKMGCEFAITDLKKHFGVEE